MDLQAGKARMRDQVAAQNDVLVRTSHQIHEHPELNYEERCAHDVLSDVLESAGIAVERHAYGLETAFVARAGSPGPTLAVLCAYDALAGLGNACGHNILTPAGLRARPAAAAVAEAARGRALVPGPPADGGAGGSARVHPRLPFPGLHAPLS